MKENVSNVLQQDFRVQVKLQFKTLILVKWRS